MSKEAEELVQEIMVKMLRATVDAIEQQALSPSIKELRATLLTTNWAAGYKAACDFLAEAFRKQAENLEQPTPAPAPEPQEFREGDLLRWEQFGVGTFVVFIKYLVTDAQPLVRDAFGHTHPVHPSKLTLVQHCPSPPKGPPVVGSYVRLANGTLRGIVTHMRNSDAPFHVRWTGDTWTWCAASRLIHLCSPEDPQDCER